MKRVIGITILGAALGVAAVAAQPAGERNRDGRKGRRGQAIVEYLGLTADQQAQWRSLSQQHREAMKPFHEEGRELRRTVREYLENDEPDAAVGEAAKAVYAHRQAAKEAREAFEGELVSVLNEEQKVKYEAFKAARGSERKGRRGRSHRGGERGHRGRGQVEAPTEG